MKKRKRPEEDTNRDALGSARNFYGKPKLRGQEVRPTRLVDFENIAKYFDYLKIVKQLGSWFMLWFE